MRQVAIMAYEELVSLDILYKEVAGLPITQIMVPVTRDGNRLILSREAIEALYSMDSTGRLHYAMDTSGRFTEASAATISAYTANVMGHVAYNASDPIFGEITSGTAVQKHQKRIAVVGLTTDGSGNCAATTVIPALAGYTAHWNAIGVHSNVADAAGTFTWAVAAGTILGPAAYTMQVAAGQFTFFSACVPNVCGVGIPLRGTIAADDNKAVTLAIADGPISAAVWVYVEYWYET